MFEWFIEFYALKWDDNGTHYFHVSNSFKSIESEYKCLKRVEFTWTGHIHAMNHDSVLNTHVTVKLAWGLWYFPNETTNTWHNHHWWEFNLRKKSGICTNIQPHSDRVPVFHMSYTIWRDKKAWLVSNKTRWDQCTCALKSLWTCLESCSIEFMA